MTEPTKDGKPKPLHVFTFSYNLGNEPSGGYRAHVLGTSEGDAKQLLIKHIEARHGTGLGPNAPHDPHDPATPAPDPNNPKPRLVGPNAPPDPHRRESSYDSERSHIYDRPHYKVSSGTVAVSDVITEATPLFNPQPTPPPAPGPRQPETPAPTVQ
jgi:hypothetical protein